MQVDSLPAEPPRKPFTILYTFKLYNSVHQLYFKKKNNNSPWEFPGGPWLEFNTFTARARAHFLVRVHFLAFKNLNASEEWQKLMNRQNHSKLRYALIENIQDFKVLNTGERM